MQNTVFRQRPLIDLGALVIPAIGTAITSILVALVLGFFASFKLGWFTAHTWQVTGWLALTMFVLVAMLHVIKLVQEWTDWIALAAIIIFARAVGVRFVD